MKILIVDDDRINSTILNRLLVRDGHEVLTAFNGRDGVEAFIEHQPDLVLMDIRMPLLNGYEAARQIKQHDSDRFTPIIFLTAVTDDEGLVKCIDAGGDDFLTKPFNRVILQAKIGAMERIQQLHRILEEQKSQLEQNAQHIQQELEVGRFLFSNIISAGNLKEAPCLKHWTAAMDQFNGDLLMASYAPSGALYVMLGDFTGHGLSAAVGALPISEIFYNLTAQGYAIADLVEQMNAKLLEVLPKRMFCAACLIEVDARQKSMLIWNGGLPDIYIVDGQGRLSRQLASHNLPLGIVPFSAEDRSADLVEFEDDALVYLFSDGLNETVNADGEMFGLSRLEGLLDGATPPDQLFDHIMSTINAHRGDAKQSDDVTLLEIDLRRALVGHDQPTTAKHTRRIPPADWKIEFHFEADLLRQLDPLPTIINAISSIQAPIGHRERLFIILSELFTNALEHGLLDLDTDLKQASQGFADYYALRAERLANLKEGEIRLQIRHTGNDLAGEFHFRVEDSGSGFDPNAVYSELEGNIRHGGRGIALVKSLCTRLTYAGKGNIAEAVYTWTCD
ncbi:ATP-binding SpoIIE family protein phosphatase [Magnetofaba australis]|uniref:Putative response regulator receiver protein n=1 Tax=Magnetofaba australis IT-1 TaxID=1434232 RepID=A0A1Y2KA13_9PROT|nr:fused response regulator/phosphatase [Magnetofaba australis]OSM08609.1 putative response regulator receiver protein [Magnetofaba australis IT-1]